MKAKVTFLMVMVAFFFASQVSAQEILTATRVVKSRGAQSEYVVPQGDNAIERPVLSRGGCVVKLDNWTGYYTRAFSSVPSRASTGPQPSMVAIPSRPGAWNLISRKPTSPPATSPPIVSVAVASAPSAKGQ